MSPSLKNAVPTKWEHIQLYYALEILAFISLTT